MTKQEFKTAFKLITGKNIEYNTVVYFRDGKITRFFKFFCKDAKVGYLKRGLLNWLEGEQKIKMSYENILNTMEK